MIDFYEYYEGLQEGWDGPALLVFSDGNKIGARLDRNGLRPARFWETDDGMVYVASEVGVLGDVLSNAKHTVRKGRLGPGQMVCADLADVGPLSLPVYAGGWSFPQGSCDRACLQWGSDNGALELSAMPYFISALGYASDLTMSACCMLARHKLLMLQDQLIDARKA